MKWKVTLEELLSVCQEMPRVCLAKLGRRVSRNQGEWIGGLYNNHTKRPAFRKEASRKRVWLKWRKTSEKRLEGRVVFF